MRQGGNHKIIILHSPNLQLDILKLIKETFNIPVFAYQVSGEYSMIAQSIKNGLLKEDAIIESLMSIKRSGASGIVTYFALEIAKKLNNKL